jgi:hypothetical protein
MAYRIASFLRMRARWWVVSVVGAAIAAAAPALRADLPVAPVPVAPAALLPALDDPSLPPLPAQSARNANYTIEARLDAERHTIDAVLVLEWRNTTGRPQDTFPFHLYWNAFRNDRSTSARGVGRRAARVRPGPRGDRGFVYLDVTSVTTAR